VVIGHLLGAICIVRAIADGSLAEDVESSWRRGIL
jgi:hypothetical protein